MANAHHMKRHVLCFLTALVCWTELPMKSTPRTATIAEVGSGFGSGLFDSRPAIVIDPGHPSENGVGASGHGVAEVHAAWEVAVRLRDSLVAAGYEVRMTETRERQVVRNV